ncbi:NUDIX domain-containing protein [Inhella sp. 1Y17]|uniref:NUDIX domain-containing protein n=2 Tax=Inhella proteolytica TaxID=2795029 RepID=A0A931NH77_9BURK|nr:NUDIX domain-containing protein [Inhella proteolytica]
MHAMLKELDARADQAPAQARSPLHWAGAETPWGSAPPVVLEQLAASGLVLQPAAPDPAAHLTELAARLRALGLSGRWRDEAVRVAHPAGPVAIERGCARVLGVPTLAVHLIGWSPDGRLWLQQRAASKAEDPNLWDTLVGGMVSAAERPREALVRETWEEAGLQLAELGPVRVGPELFSRRPVSDAQGLGYLQERLLTAQVTVPPGRVPQNQDGEVRAFALWTPDEVRAGIARGEFTLDAARLLLRVID